MEEDSGIIDFVKEVLSHIGIDAQRIKRNPQIKTPDLRGQDHADAHYLFEIKTKIDGGEFLDSRSAALNAGSIFDYHRKLTTPRGKQSLRKAASQLKASSEHSFRVVVRCCTGIEAESEMNQSLYTIYGLVDTFGFGASYDNSIPGPGEYSKRCYYFNWSLFRECPHVDGALLLLLLPNKPCASQLLINDWAANYEEFRQCKLGSFYREQGAVIDPRVEEESGEALSYRGIYENTSKSDRIQNLRRKYDDRRLNIIEMQVHSAEVAVSTNRGNQE